jgi:hypothetical protein
VVVKSFGTGFPAVAARHGCQLPGHVTGPAGSAPVASVSGPQGGHTAGQDLDTVARPVVPGLATNLDTVPATGQDLDIATGLDMDIATCLDMSTDLDTTTGLDVAVATCLDMAGAVGPATPTAVTAGRAGSLTPVSAVEQPGRGRQTAVSATLGGHVSADGRVSAAHDRGDRPVTPPAAGPAPTVAATDTRAAARPVASGVTPDVAGVTGPSPSPSPGRGDRWGDTLPVCCPVCELPIDPAWSATNRTDRHGPCAA